MKIRTKVILIITLTSCVAIALVLIASQTVLLGQFSNLESSYVTDTTQLTGNLLQTDIASIQNSVASNLGMWDDTYSFIQGQNPGYIQDNFGTAQTLESMGCQSALFINSVGQDYYNVSYDDSYQNQVAFPAALADEFISHPELWNFTDATGSSEGVISVPGQSGEVLLFGAAPILPSNGSGQVMGAVVVFKILDTAEVQSLQQRAGVPVTVLGVNATGGNPDFQAALSYILKGNNFYTQPLNSSTIFGYESIKDVFGNPAVILRIEMPRNIWNSGILTTEYYAIMVLVSIALIAVVFFVFLERTVISRLSGLTKEAKKIADSGDLNMRATVSGKDEVGQLSSAINEMLDNTAGPVKALSGVAEKIAGGDLDVNTNVRSKGDILVLINSMNIMVDSLKQFVGSINKNTGVTASSAGALSSSAEEVNSSMDHMTSTIQKIAQDSATVKMLANEAEEKVKKTEKSSEEGADVAKKVGATMDDISNATKESAGKIMALGTKSKEISDIVSTISNLSSQTSLLALNAAIEAARAGDAGRGFAVVADEVRKLAEESKKAADRTSSLIAGIQSEIKDSVNTINVTNSKVDQGEEAVKMAVKTFESIPPLVDDVNKALRRMAAVAQENASAVDSLSASSEEVTSSMEEVSSAAQRLAHGADDLRTLASKFKVADADGEGSVK